MKGFDVTTVAGRTILHLDSDRINDCMRYYQEMDIDSLSIIPGRGYKADNLNFLKEYSEDVKELTVVSPPAFTFDLSPILTLNNLRVLVLNDSVPFPLNKLPNLEKFYGRWHKDLQLADCIKLEVLSLSGYKSRSKDLTDFPDFPFLADLTLVQSSLISLRGLSKLNKLTRLELSYLTKLESLYEVDNLQGLEILELHTCKKIADHDNVRFLKKLKVIRFNNCGEIPTLRFIEEMPRLEEFRFVNTNILDGDLTPLTKLLRVGFFAKKHYSHTPEEMDAILRPKGGSAVSRFE